MFERELRALCARWYFFSGNGMDFASWGMIRPSLVLYGIWEMNWQSNSRLGETVSDHEVLTSLPLRLRQVQSLVSSII